MSCFFLSFFFFPRLISAVAELVSTILSLNANLECRSDMYCTRLAENTGRKKSPSRHHRTTLSDCIFTSKACIDNGKNLLNSSSSSTCPYNMVNFGLLTAEIGSGVWDTPAYFNGFRVLACVTARHSSSGRQSNFAELNRSQRAPPTFGRAAITLGTGPHSSCD